MSATATSTGTAAVLRPALAGAAATLSGIGLSRFAYVPLFPAMVASGWISGGEGGLLGALNLGGYLAGVIGGRALARRTGTGRALDLGFGLAALAFAGCSWNGGTAWLAIWRFMAGASGGVLMALAGPAVQGSVPPSRRGFAGGIVMSGVAVGILMGVVLIPLTLPLGLSTAWIGLAATVLLLWGLAHSHLPDVPVSPASTPVVPATTLHLAYGLSGAAFVPHMVYFGDFAVRGRGYESGIANLLWLGFGLGALVGPLLGGQAADRLGAAAALRLWLGLQVVALAASLVNHPVALAISGLLGGFSAVGLTAIALARARELAGMEAGGIWVRSTGAFAVAQATAGLALAALFAVTNSHFAIFLAGFGLAVAALAVSAFGPTPPRPGG